MGRSGARRRVKGRSVRLIRDAGAEHFTLEVVKATEERKNHGDVIESERLIGGTRIRASYAEGTTAYEAMARDGLLGAGAARTRRLEAAEWFHRQAETARLRARVSGTYANGSWGSEELTEHQSRARKRLSGAGKTIGGEAFDVLVDVIAWNIRPLIVTRVTRFVAALDLLARYLRLPGDA